MNWRYLAIVALILGLPAASGATMGVWLNLEEELPFATGNFATQCADSRFSAFENGFRFSETSDGDETSLRMGCGTASWRLHLPAGAKQISVDFSASRDIESVSNAPVNFEQVLQLRDTNGADLISIDYFAPEAARAPMQNFTNDLFQAPGATQQLDLVWKFQDRGTSFVQGMVAVDPGHTYSSEIRNPHVVYRNVIPAGVTQTSDQSLEGTFQVEESIVRLSIGAQDLARYGISIVVPIPAGYAFDYVKLPTGVSVRAGDAMIQGAQVEGELFVIPPGITEAGGSGSYEIHLRSVVDVTHSKALLPIAILLVLAPMPVAVLALLGVQKFEREAFGKFRISAARLRVAVVLASLFYIVVLLGAFTGGQLGLMAVWPLQAAALFLYLQVAVAIGAFGTMLLVAKALVEIVNPPKREV